MKQVRLYTVEGVDITSELRAGTNKAGADAARSKAGSQGAADDQKNCFESPTYLDVQPDWLTADWLLD